jgi:hypothetical protein
VKKNQNIAPLAPCGLVGITILVPHIQQDNSLEPP